MCAHIYIICVYTHIHIYLYVHTHTIPGWPNPKPGIRQVGQLVFLLFFYLKFFFFSISTLTLPLASYLSAGV